MENTEQRLELLEQTVNAYREFLTLIVKLLIDKQVLSREELHDGWAGIMSSINAQEAQP